MKLHIAMLAATLLLSGGASYAQGNKQEKKGESLHGGRCPSGHSVELGCTDYH